MGKKASKAEDGRSTSLDMHRATGGKAGESHERLAVGRGCKQTGRQNKRTLLHSAEVLSQSSAVFHPTVLRRGYRPG